MAEDGDEFAELAEELCEAEEESTIVDTPPCTDLVAESAVGITEFVGQKRSGFSGIIKHCFSDFKVYEISLQGKIAQLGEQLCDPSLIKGEEGKKGSTSLPSLEQIQEALSGIIKDASFLQQLSQFLIADTRPEWLETLSLPSREERTLFHTAIRSLFGGRLITETNGDRIRVISRRDALQNNKRCKIDDRNLQSPDQQRYLSLVLQKTGMDTIEAIQFLARRLHINAKDLSYAGTKDRRAITTQFIVLRNATPAKALSINKLCEPERLRISDVQIAKEPLNLGDLQGNRFELVIRAVQGAYDHEIIEAVEEFRNEGFVNYFGLQRFGTGSVPTYQIGQALLAGQWKMAIDLILSIRQDEGDRRAKEARKVWVESGDAAKAHDLFPTRFIAERQILAYYARDPANKNNHLGAILAISRELRLLYVHSLQSHIWNRMASLRMAQTGIQVGDLVLDEEDKPKIITAQTIDKYNMQDIVLPLPGYKSIYPQTKIGQVFQDLLREQLCLSDDPLSLLTAFSPKTRALWDLPGAYRKVLVKPTKVEYRIGYYANPDDDLSKEDLSQHPSMQYPHRALFLAFSLPASSYATMALRQVMRMSTDPRQHKERTRLHRTDQRSADKQ